MLPNLAWKASGQAGARVRASLAKRAASSCSRCFLLHLQRLRMKYEMYIFVPGEVEEKVDSELEEDRLVVAVLGDGNPLGGVGVAHGGVHQPTLLVQGVPVLQQLVQQDQPGTKE